MWANEQEAAVLSGYSPEAFRAALSGLEKAGFPQVSRWNSKRYIPAIINFWASQVDSCLSPVAESEDEAADGPEVENFGHGRTQRRA